MKNYKMLTIIVAILAIFILPNLSHALGFHGMDNNCPMLFNVRFGDPAEYVIKQISQKTKAGSYESKVSEEGNTVITWDAKNPQASQEVVMAFFDKNMRLFGMTVLIKTFEMEYIDEVFGGMLNTLRNCDESEMRLMEPEGDEILVRGICNEIAYEFEFETGTNSYGNTMAVASVMTFKFQQ